MANYLGHNRNYVLLLVVVVAIILLVLWVLFRDDKNSDCSDSYSDSRYYSGSESRDTRYTKDSKSTDCDKYSSDSYSESYSHEDESK